jgi:hypothetical protein
MKLTVRSAAISGFLMLATAGIAQDKTTAPAPAKMEATPARAGAAAPRVNDGFRGINLGMLIKQVGITPDQTTQLKELNAKYYQMHNTMGAEMPLEERKAKVVSMMADREAELKKVLTAEQLTKYAEMGTMVKPTRPGTTTTAPVMEEKKVETPKK